jgi:redox-sensitive bicupin YhaK (pirin superfamily)
MRGTADIGPKAMSDPIELIIEPRPRDLGDFTVRRSLPDSRRQRVGPFIFFDHMGPVDFQPGSGINVRPHPHIGLATITYLFDGEILHRDSLGFRQPITRGAVNWMTAGRGIVHSERTPEELRASGSHMHGIQTWVALPVDQEECEPRFEHYPASQIPSIAMDGANLRVIVGSAFDATSPVRTASDTIYVELNLAENANLDIPDVADELALYVVNGEVDIGATAVGEGTMAVLRAGHVVPVHATVESRLMLFGGATLSGKRTIWWNFVSSSGERLEKAKSDWREQRFDRVPGEVEFIPLPES